MRRVNYNHTTEKLVKFCSLSAIKMLLCICGLSVNMSADAQVFGYVNPFSPSTSEQQVKTEPAKYKGGMNGLNKFIAKEFRTVREESMTDGRIIVACVIGEKGRIVETRIVTGLSDALNKEALRVVKKLKFKPAMQGKKKIKSRINITFPIRHGRASFSTLKTVDV